MRIVWAAATGAALLAGAAAAAPAGETARNRMVIARFADIFYRQKDVKRAFETYVVSNYVQHNPDIADGRAAAETALAQIFGNPRARFDIEHIVVDGDMAVIHVHARPAPDQRGGAVADIYRLKDGKIVEHWDVLQPIPAHAANPHPMF